MEQRRSKNWCFTSFEPEPPVFLDCMEYLCYQQELCPKTGRNHWQGYVQFSSKKNIRNIQSLLQDFCIHLEQSKGTPAQARDYCHKTETAIEGSFAEFGRMRARGERSDLSNLADDIINGVSVRTVAMAYPTQYIRYHTGIKGLNALVSIHGTESRYQLSDYPNWTPVTDWSKTVVIQGASGMGKTQFALAHFKNALLVSGDPDRLADFDPSLHDGIVFDEGTYTHLPREIQIHLIDMELERDIRVRYRTAVIPAGTKRIITTNKLLREVFSVPDPAIERRLNIIVLRVPYR